MANVNEINLEEIFQDLQKAISVFNYGGKNRYELSASGSKFMITAEHNLFSGVMLKNIYDVTEKHELSMVVQNNILEVSVYNV